MVRFLVSLPCRGREAHLRPRRTAARLSSVVGFTWQDHPQTTHGNTQKEGLFAFSYPVSWFLCVVCVACLVYGNMFLKGPLALAASSEKRSLSGAWPLRKEEGKRGGRLALRKKPLGFTIWPVIREEPWVVLSLEPPFGFKAKLRQPLPFWGSEPMRVAMTLIHWQAEAIAEAGGGYPAKASG